MIFYKTTQPFSWFYDQTLGGYTTASSWRKRKEQWASPTDWKKVQIAERSSTWLQKYAGSGVMFFFFYHHKKYDQGNMKNTLGS